MTRQVALEIINRLYGLETSYMHAALEKLGPAALSDGAVRWIAQRQRDEQEEKDKRAGAIAAYQSRNPQFSWQECEELIEKKQAE